jgi:HlyD family secretion protein
MRRPLLIVLVLAAIASVAGAAWWYSHLRGGSGELVLYGNIDLRQVELAFNNSERIAEVLVQEGDHVKQGQVLARLDTSRLEPQVAQAEAQAAAQRQVVEKLHNGTRPEEIEQARANVEAAKAEQERAKELLKRNTSLVARQAISQQEYDDAKAAFDVAEARVMLNQKALDLALAGPRKEDVAEGEHRLAAAEATLAFLKQQLADCELKAPSDAVVRTRILEPGEMASPQRPVYSLAIIDPKWVRAYVSEPDLGKIRPGMKASISVDSFPNRTFEGWVGFISPVAEFTPKPVQTEQLRTSLVYEVRVFVKDPEDVLRLGMPATVRLDTEQSDAGATKAPQ